MKRLFIGIMASSQLQRSIVRWRRGKEDWPVRWIAERNLHITLVPPFKAEPKKIIKELRGLEFGLTGSIVSFGSIEIGLNKKEPRLIWAKANAFAGLEELKNAIETSLGFEASERKFLPHLTLARLNLMSSGIARSDMLPQNISWRENIESFELIESQLLPSGAEYKVLASFPLGNHGTI